MRREILTVALCIAVAASISIQMPAAQAQDYPTRTVRILVGSAPGSTTDIVGRVVAEGLHTRLGQTFVVENNSGANGMVAAETVAKATPDGYTVLAGFHPETPKLPSPFEGGGRGWG